MEYDNDVNVSNDFNFIESSLFEKQFYKEGFFTKLVTEELVRGIGKNVVYAISLKRFEPNWMLKFRLNAYKSWIIMKEPHWLNANYTSLNYNDYSYYSTPISNNLNKNKISELNIYENKNYLTTEVKNTFNKLGIPTNDNDQIAVDAIFDSVSVSTTYCNKLSQQGVIFCSFNEALCKYSKLIRKYLGTIVSFNDNFFSALNSAMVSDGTFVYIPKNIYCPIELSTYFRINSFKTGQFERTIIIAEEGSYVSYIEGCSSPSRDNYQLHAAVVEIIIFKNAIVRYSTVQNWSVGDNLNKGILNFVTKRALCFGENSKMSWTQSETGSIITWKYPSVILYGNNSIGEFFSVTLTNGYQKADTGTKMIHIGKNTKSTIISKGISIGMSVNTYRGLLKIMFNAVNSRNFTQCDSMLVGNKCISNTFPCIEISNNTSILEHEATISSVNEDQLFYCRQRGISKDTALILIINGFCKNIFYKLPLEFSVEAQKLLSISLKNSVG